MIPQDTVNKILDSAQIVEVISDFVSLKRRGANFIACCPFHNEKTPSFYVSPSKGIYKCFGCGKSGTAVGFVMEHESMTYVEALKYLAKKYGIEVKEKEDSPEEIAARQRSESLYLVMDFAEKFFQESLKTPEGRSIGYAYFRSRGLEDSTIEKYGLGWSPKGGSVFSREALAKGYKEEFLTATGVSIKRNDGSLIDKFYDRVMFPIHSVSGRVIAFGGRTLRSDYKTANIGKYVNSPETEIYDKSRSLYGIYFAKSEISRQDKCFLVEGYLDVLSMHQLGITNVVASSGTSLTVPQIRLIKKFTSNVTIMYDGDAAGQHAILRALDIFEEEGVPARVLDFPGGMDPDEYIKAYGPQSVEQLKPVDATAYRMKQEATNHDLSTVEGRTAYAIACAKYLAKVKEPVELENYVKQLMVSTGFTREVLLAQIGRTELIEEKKRPMFRHAARPLEEKNDGVDTETAAAERGLLILLAEGGVEPGTITADDFISPQRRILAQKLLGGMKPASILEEIDDEDERSRTAKLLTSESGAGEQELRMVADYLRVLEKKRRENEINALKEKMSTQQGEEKRSTLMRIQELLAQEKKTGRRE